MKKLCALVLTLAVGMTPALTYAVDSDADADVVKLSQSMRGEYRPGQVIVKFKGSSSVRTIKRAGVVQKSLGVTAVDNALSSLGVKEIEELMPLTGAQTMSGSVKGINGKAVVAQSMAKAYLLTIDADVPQAIETLQAMGEVEFAEPNYLVHTLDFKRNDPYYSQQWGLKAANIEKLWGAPQLDRETPVIAIIDTGVDVNHPDLKNNIWINTKEKAGVQGYDDDGNGYKDDINGWDFINNTGVMHDFNGHGTHCAGIAAAEGGNGIGVIGACPFARIMPIAALQSDGTGDIATLIKALDYASANGADVISMSLGTYSTSMAFEQALARAYQKAILVAAAGNDGYSINKFPTFPAAYSFVVGVQATTQSGGLAGFSNYDDDGPTFSEYGGDKMYNYEIAAPGGGILSTYPNGNYRTLSGTSMSTPLVAGAICQYMMSREVVNKEELFGDLIHASQNGVLDIYAAYQIDDASRRPELQFVSMRIEEVDGDGDGVIDAGETIAFYPTIRNLYGTASNIRYTVSVAEEANTICEIENAEAQFGSNLSGYASAEATNPVTVKMNADVADGRHCRFLLTATCDDTDTPIARELMYIAENGTELRGIIGQDLTLTSDKNYLVVGNVFVNENITLTIEPGTIIKFKENAVFKVSAGSNATSTNDSDPILGGARITHYKYPTAAKIIAHGTKENPIVFKGAENVSLDFGRNLELKYCVFTDFGDKSKLCISNEAHASKENVVKALQESGIFGKNLYITMAGEGFVDNCVIKDNSGLSSCYINSVLPYGIQNEAANYNNMCSNSWPTYRGNTFGLNNIGNFANIIGNETEMICPIENVNIKNNIFGNYFTTIQEIRYEDISFTLSGSAGNIAKPFAPMYLGTGKLEIAQRNVLDINDDYGLCQYDFSTLRTRPYSEAHGIVWKVVVNGYDAQDQYDELPPLGVGRHKVEVYFNRKMNHEVTPNVAMGVRPPYNQLAIAEEGSWRTETYDGDEVDIYTTYVTVTGRQKIDGVNRISVTTAQDDEYFEIPVEDMRFNVNVQSAGSLSTGFFGEPGVGCVKLEWEDLDMNFEDIMGYNLYRRTADTEPVRVNSSLLAPEDNHYVDYDVKTGTTYIYYYKVMTTDLVENDPSKTIAVTPTAAEMGDANGSGSVDVNDILTTVNYIGGGDPKPFIYDAADMNADEQINILDVVGIAHAILDGPASSQAIKECETAYYWVEDGKLWIDSSEPIGGLQVKVTGDRATNSVLATDALAGMETMGQWRSDDEYIFLSFSLGKKSLQSGEHAVLNLGEGADVDELVLGDTNACVIPVERVAPLGIDEVEAESESPVARGVYNSLGIKVATDESQLDRLPAGFYVVNGKKIIKR